MLATRKKDFIFILAVVLIASLALVATRPAYAAEPNCSVWGNTKIFTWDGITATHKAGIEVISWDTQKLVTGWAYIKTNQSISANKIGASAQLYNSAGLLVKSTNVLWNASGDKEIGVGASTFPSTGSRYYAGGLAYIQGTHNEYDPCAYSPTVTCSTGDFSDPLLNATYFEVNSNGQTYGSMVSANSVGEKPELVSAKGVNGVEGYIYYNQWLEATTASSESTEAESIPLFSQDGITQIGTFELSEPTTI